MISDFSDGYFGMMRDIGIGYQIAKEQRVKEREKLLHQGNSDADLIAWEEREQLFPFPFSRGQTMAYNAWKESKTNGLEIIECSDLPWENDLHDFIGTFREAKIEAIVVTDSTFSIEKHIRLFEDEGCKVVGPQAFIRHEKRSTRVENVSATGVLILIGDTTAKVVDSDD